MVHLRSSFRFSPDKIESRRFRNAHDQWLLTTAAHGGLQPVSADRLRGTNKPSSRVHIAWRTVIGIVDNLGLKTLFVSQYLPPKKKSTHVEVTEQRRDRRTLWGSTFRVLVLGGSMFSTSRILFFHRCFEPPLDKA